MTPKPVCDVYCVIISFCKSSNEVIGINISLSMLLVVTELNNESDIFFTPGSNDKVTSVVLDFYHLSLSIAV